jgi:hypothetical protein
MLINCAQAAPPDRPLEQITRESMGALVRFRLLRLLASHGRVLPVCEGTRKSVYSKFFGDPESNAGGLAVFLYSPA